MAAGWVKVDPNDPGADFIPDGEFVSDEDKYGGIGGSAAAAGLGALRSATLGLSDVALTKTGLMEPETLKGYEETNPISSFTGEVGGVFLPTGVAGLLGKAGKAVTSGVKALKAVQTAGEVSNAAKVLGATADIGAHAMGSAVEGAIYSGVGNSLHEYALGDPSLNGEKIATNFLHGFVAGGVLGGGLKAVTTLVPPAVGAARDALVKVKNTIMGTGTGEGGLIGKGLAAAGLGDVAEGWAGRINNLDIDQRVKVANDASKDLNTLWKNIATTLHTVNKEIRPQEVEALINTANPEKVIAGQQGVLTRMSEAVQESRRRPVLYQQRAIAKLDDLHSEIASGLKDQSPLNIYNKLKDAKSRLDDMVFTKVPTAEMEDTLNLLRPIREEINATLKNSEIFGDVGSRLASHDEVLSGIYKFIAPGAKSAHGATDFQKAYGTFSGKGPNAKWAFDAKKVETVFKRAETTRGAQEMTMLEDFYRVLQGVPDHVDSVYKNVPNPRFFDSAQLKNIIENSESTMLDSYKKYKGAVDGSKKSLGLGDYATGAIVSRSPIIAAAIGAYNIATKPLESMAKLAQLERVLGQTTQKINAGVNRVFEPTANTLSKAIGPGTRIMTESHYEDSKKELLETANNPDLLIEKLMASTKEMADVAPDMTSQTQITANKALQFLTTRLPGPTDSQNPFQPTYKPSKAELSRFNNYYSVVKDPKIALDQLATGTLTPQTMETLREVYPGLLQYMQTQVLQQAANRMAKKQPIPFKSKQSMSLFLGQPLDRSFLPQNIMNNQKMLMRPMGPPQMGPGRSKGTKSKFTLSQRTGLVDDPDANA